VQLKEIERTWTHKKTLTRFQFPKPSNLNSKDIQQFEIQN